MKAVDHIDGPSGLRGRQPTCVVMDEPHVDLTAQLKQMESKLRALTMELEATKSMFRNYRNSIRAHLEHIHQGSK